MNVTFCLEDISALYSVLTTVVLYRENSPFKTMDTAKVISQ